MKMILIAMHFIRQSHCSQFIFVSTSQLEVFYSYKCYSFYTNVHSSARFSWLINFVYLYAVLVVIYVELDSKKVGWALPFSVCFSKGNFLLPVPPKVSFLLLKSQSTDSLSVSFSIVVSAPLTLFSAF
jgi:hypothetical protein